MDELFKQLQVAKTSGSYMVAIWKIKNNRLDLFRMTENFPCAEVLSALDLLYGNLEPLLPPEEEEVVVADSQAQGVSNAIHNAAGAAESTSEAGAVSTAPKVVISVSE